MKRRTFLSSKKGFIGDVLVTAIFLFILAVSILSAYLVLNSVNTAFQASDDMSVEGKAIIAEQQTSFTSTWDFIFGFLLVGLSIAIFISAFMIDTHPVFLVISLLTTVIFIIVAATIANAYYAVESTAAMSSFAEDFKIMHYVMNHLPYYVLIMAFMVMIALYAKTRQYG